MNGLPNVAYWIELLVVLALGVTVIVALTALSSRSSRNARWGKTAWRACNLAILAFLLTELAGVGGSVSRWAKPSPPAPAGGLVLEMPYEATTQELVPEPAEGRSTPIHFRLLPEPWMARSTWIPGLVWGLGAVLLIARRTWNQIRLRMRMSREGSPASSELQLEVDRLAKRLGVRHVRAWVWPELTGPSALGIFRPVVAVPPSFVKDYSIHQQRAILVHEVAHHAFHDPAWHLLSDIVMALTWWHPLIRWGAGCQRRAAEKVADEASLLLSGGPDHLAECLVLHASRFVPSGMTGGSGLAEKTSPSHLRQRIERLMDLSGETWRAPGRVGPWFVQTLAPATLIVVALVATGWARSDLPDEGSLEATMQGGAAGFAMRGPANPEILVELHFVGQVESKKLTSLVNAPDLYGGSDIVVLEHLEDDGIAEAQKLTGGKSMDRVVVLPLRGSQAARVGFTDEIRYVRDFELTDDGPAPVYATVRDGLVLDVVSSWVGDAIRVELHFDISDLTDFGERVWASSPKGNPIAIHLPRVSTQLLEAELDLEDGRTAVVVVRGLEIGIPRGFRLNKKASRDRSGKDERKRKEKEGRGRGRNQAKDLEKVRNLVLLIKASRIDDDAPLVIEAR